MRSSLPFSIHRLLPTTATASTDPVPCLPQSSVQRAPSMALIKRSAAALGGGANPAGATCRKKSRRIGTTADYEQDSYLGEGGYGYVVKGRHRATGQAFAIKCHCDPFDEDVPVDARQLLREARFLEACGGNPYLVGFHGVVRDYVTGDLRLVMEYVHGPSLHGLLRKRRGGPPLPEDTVRAFMWQLLTGTKKMHDRHIVHRDIKPHNILVGDGEGGGETLKICDLGVAMSLSEAPPYRQAGTMMYQAPEMALGKPDYDALVDTWSLGCVMAEIITGDVLFEESTRFPLLRRIFHVLGVPDDTTWPGFTSLPVAAGVSQLPGQRNRLRDLFPEEKLSKEGFEVLSGLLACNPDKRLTAAAALKLPWFATAAANAPPADAKVDAMSVSIKEEEVEIAPSTSRRKRVVAKKTIPKKKAQAMIPPAT